jgi:hypothetical protein
MRRRQGRATQRVLPAAAAALRAPSASEARTMFWLAVFFVALVMRAGDQARTRPVPSPRRPWKPAPSNYIAVKRQPRVWRDVQFPRGG